ncbi:hypothetical protein ANME2D_00420 [Candidatus Methanoperedens nitroreducens]|uniref:Uncharacterized protein n=1 Tax=Candidatus Methanoperedens nitratireducens TaxID=1392998 RepID=A0A062VCE0_9EURY|nr:hypothetical protein [Candidatus Methanoperedens nitroreducens]KCZ73354.1 hypothetical protein ANME2D_00420 [Candidatus Methanoperedens nitroreducens]MDJ1422697.1 hypothetical protein [Candidatus Methanoperedens sp.]
MLARKLFIYSLIILLTIYPASASEVSLNKWVLNITLRDDGLVEAVIQAEIENSNSLSLDGFSFVVPGSKVDIIDDQFISIPATGQVIEQQVVPGGIRVTINFNKPIKAGEKWNGRFSLIVEGWAVKQNLDYSIDIPIEAPQAIVSGKSTEVSVPEDADIRGQVFLPKSVELISVEPEPFRKLFQYDRIVPTWSPEKLHVGDTIRIKGSFSDVLNKIVEVDERSRSLSDRIKEATAQGIDTSEAEKHLTNANDYNNNQALASFWKKEYSVALEYAGYADDELTRAESSLSVKGEVKETPQTSEKTPGFEAPVLVFILLIIFMIRTYAKR